MPSHIFAKRKMKGKLTSRPCPCCDELRNTKQIWLNSKKFAEQEIEVGVNEMFSFSNDDITNDPYMRSLFPKSNRIECYFHYIFGYHVLVVDGKFQGELEAAYELLAYAYHTGSNYKDYDDLSTQFYNDLKAADDVLGFYLP